MIPSCFFMLAYPYLCEQTLDQKRPKLVILDSYYVTPKYMETLKKAVPLLYIDDLNAFDYPADFVLNYNVYGPEILYPTGKVYFLGPKYVPLRKEFQGLNQCVMRGRAKNVLISTGGTDPYHVALHCVRFLQKHIQCSEITYHFILGVMNSDVEEIEKAASGLPNIKLHQQVKNICVLMQQCDAAISAAGSTLYELCACGIPTVTYVLADNQILGAQAFRKIGLMPCAGDVRTDKKLKSEFSLNFLRWWKMRKNEKRYRCRCKE